MQTTSVSKPCGEYKYNHTNKCVNNVNDCNSAAKLTQMSMEWQICICFSNYSKIKITINNFTKSNRMMRQKLAIYACAMMRYDALKARILLRDIL